MTQPGPLPPPVPNFGPTPYPPAGFFPPAYYPPPRQGGGFARAVFNTLAVSVLGFSLSLNVYLLIASGLFGGGGHGVTKTTVRAGDAKNVVAVVPIVGAINANTVEDVNKTLGEVESDANVKAVVLEVNSPGGEVTASDQIYARIKRFRKEKGLPVVVSMGALATSGGYYVACAADQIVAQRTTWTGNIGVLFPRYNVAELAARYGVKDSTLKSTGATFKDAGSPLKEETPEERAYWQHLLDTAFDEFKGVVAAGRNLSPDVVDRIANGQVYNGPDALKLKLVDAIGYEDDAIDLAATKAGLAASGPQAVRYDRTHGFLESIGGGSGQFHGGAVDLNVGGATVSVDRAFLSDLMNPRAMYLWQGR